MVSNLKKLILCTIFACGVAAPLSGCGNSPESEGPYAPTSENYVYPKTLELATEKVTLRVGERLTVKYSISPSGARNDEALWFTSNDTVVYVADGVLMGVGKGTATVTVVVGGLKSSMEVTVIDTGGGDTKSIVLSTNSMKLKVGGSAPIKAYANPATEVVNWASSNEAVAKYENGNIVAVSKGECDITATISDGLFDVCHVTVDDATPGPTPGPDPQGWTGSIRVGAPLGEMQFMRELLDDFNRDTGSTVNFEVTQWEEGNGPDNLPQSLGDGPDIFPYVSDQTIGFYQRNALAQLPTSSVTFIKQSMGDDVANYAKLNGTTKFIGYPFAGDNGYVMFYNKTLAASAGISNISNVSMTELLTAAKNADLEVDFPINNAFYAAGSLMSYSKDESGNAKSLYTLTMKSGGTSYSVASSFNSNAGLLAAKQIRGLFDFSGTLQLATETPTNGTLATIVDCSKVSAFKLALGSDYGAAPLPFIDDTKTVRYANYSGLKFYGINPGRAADHMDLANAVAKYLVSEAAQLKRFNKLHIKPTLKTLLEKQEVQDEPHVKALIEQGAANTIPLTAVDSALWSQAAVAIKSIKALTASASDAEYKAILQELDDSLYK